MGVGVTGDVWVVEEELEVVVGCQVMIGGRGSEGMKGGVEWILGE